MTNELRFGTITFLEIEFFDFWQNLESKDSVQSVDQIDNDLIKLSYDVNYESSSADNPLALI